MRTGKPFLLTYTFPVLRSLARACTSHTHPHPRTRTHARAVERSGEPLLAASTFFCGLRTGGRPETSRLDPTPSAREPHSPHAFHRWVTPWTPIMSPCLSTGEHAVQGVRELCRGNEHSSARFYVGALMALLPPFPDASDATRAVDSSGTLTSCDISKEFCYASGGHVAGEPRLRSTVRWQQR